MKQAPRFDRDPTLAELLRGVPAAALQAALARTLGPHWELLDVDGGRVAGPGLDGGAGAPAEAALRLGIDPLGRVRADGPSERALGAVAAWLQLVLAGAERYRMAADLHLEAVDADYQALQEKHAALQASEARYRELSGQLEQRVAQQAAVIERAQRQLFQSEKMASVGTLAAGMAHEINNPIGFIRSNLGTAAGYVEELRATLLAFRGGDQQAGQEAWRAHDVDMLLDDFPVLLNESQAGADRVAQIVGHLKAYASVDCAGAEAADLNAALRTVAAVLADQLPGTVRLELALAAALPALSCDASRIKQMLFALVQNARQALAPQGGLIRLSSALEGDAIRLTVEDDGCGVAPAIRARVFDPFFTTRDVGQGTGLGLAVARDIVTAHGGSIALGARAGGGTCVTVELPLSGLGGKPA